MNFKKNVVPPTKKPLFAGYEGDYTMEMPKKSVSLLTLGIVVVFTFVLAFLLFKNYDRISNWFVSSVDVISEFDIGQEIEVSGLLQSDGDLISYTHTLLLEDDKILGLKSRTLDLSIYSGIVDIQGVIEREIDDMFVVEVNFVSGSLIDTGDIDETLLTGSGLYISQAGIYLPEGFNQKYALLNNGENNILKVQNITNNQIIQISYFTCKPSDPNKNCLQLQKNISSNAEKSISTSYGTTAYKVEGVTSWFFTNGNYFGYFINDVSDQDVVNLVNEIILPTEYYVKNTLLSKMQVLCTDGTTSMMQISNQSFVVDVNGFVVTLQGPTVDGSASCKLFIDPSMAAGGTKISYITNTPNSSPDTSVISSSVSDLDTSVKQFPINLEKTLTFTSSRGYSIVFPSSNIAYEAVNISDDLGLPGVRCSSQMNVTKFADKETLHEDPKVSIFMCNIKGTLNNLSNTMIQITAENGMQFIIQVIDGAWYDFATNIQIN